MKSSQNFETTLQSELVQLPLKGFRTEVKSPKKSWRRFIETKSDGRQVYISVKNR